MRRSCALCYRPFFLADEGISPYLCLRCYQRLTPAPPSYGQGSSLFLYEDNLRQLILRTKVDGDQYALACLVELFLYPSQRLGREAAWARQVVAAPSSLWGRLRGRIDLAWFLAQAFATKYKLPLIAAPFSLHWRLFKRAQLRRYEAHNLLFEQANASIPTLIIDDIITTGYTVASVAHKLQGASCRFLTLGDAFRGKKPTTFTAPRGGARR